MNNPYEILGISTDATPAQAKAAYHTKLRQFPAHTHPTEFKAIRTAYETIQKGGNQASENFFALRPIEATIEPAVIQDLQEKLSSHLKVSLEEMLRGTF